MQTHIIIWTKDQGWKGLENTTFLERAEWVLYFGAPTALDQSNAYQTLNTAAPNAIIMGGSSSGEILGDEVQDDTIVAIAAQFSATRLKPYYTGIETTDGYEAGKKNGQSYRAGADVAKALDAPDLKNIFILSDGLHINGTELVKGVFENITNKEVILTGGLAGNGNQPIETLVGINHPARPHRVAAVGFYGAGLNIGYASVGGWDAFGPERIITKSDGNILYELDGKSALELYRNYLAEFFYKIGGTHMFPLSIRPQGAPEEYNTVRTVMTIDMDNECLIFGGDVPQGYMAQLMRANIDHLIDGAAHAAINAAQREGRKWDLAVLVSCVGRKMLMGQRISDETEAVAEILGNTPTIGFYSNGEICHHTFTGECNLHNQTMTITLFAEQ